MAECSFIVRLYKNQGKLGWAVQSIFTIGECSINKSKNRDVVIYLVGFNDLINIIIPHFEKYSLFTQKASDLILFKQVVELIKKFIFLLKDFIKLLILKQQWI